MNPPVLAFALLPAAGTAFDRSAFDALLRAHVAGGPVDCDAFERSQEFRAYLGRLADAKAELLAAQEQLAFWINVYNAYTIEQVIAHHERESIRNIRKALGLFPLKGPWSERMVRAAGQALSLDEVEHDELRARFHEPRIHFALVCAALGCPPLRSEAYVGARIDEQLDEAFPATFRGAQGYNNAGSR
jgi:hypothetical protein